MKLIDGDGNLHDLPDSSSSDMSTIRRKLDAGWLPVDPPDGCDPQTWPALVEAEIQRRRARAQGR